MNKKPFVVIAVILGIILLGMAETVSKMGLLPMIIFGFASTIWSGFVLALICVERVPASVKQEALWL